MKFALLGNQLVQTNQTVASLLNVPGGTSLLTWNGTGFTVNNFDADFGWDDGSATLANGKGFFLKNNSANPITLTFVGEVNQQTNSVNFTSGVLNLVSLFTPQAGLLQTDFKYPATGGDSVLLWNGTGYTVIGYDPDFGWDAEPQLNVGDGFFVKPAANKVWTRSFTVQ